MPNHRLFVDMKNETPERALYRSPHACRIENLSIHLPT